MAIKIFSNRIELGSGNTTFCLYEASDRLCFTGKLYLKDANTFINYTFTPSIVGSISGYSSGGFAPPNVNTIDKFPFAADANATDVGDLTEARAGVGGASSKVSGYTFGGELPTFAASNTIDKFPFASNANATDVGDLVAARYGVKGNTSCTHGYAHGGSAYDNIYKFPFATDGNATDVGILAQVHYGTVATHSSLTNGYVAAGTYAFKGCIQKFPFATNTNSSSIACLSIAREAPSGQSSYDNGYTSGGTNVPGLSNVIDKFPFATDASATDVGDLTQSRYQSAAQNSTSSGYVSGGLPPYLNTIDKFPFASNANATDVGDLTQSRSCLAGNQY